MPSSDDRDIIPRPDPTVLTTAQLDREIGHLKELSERDRDGEREARRVALESIDRRLESTDRRLLEFPELRNEIAKMRGEFVSNAIYGPAHEELRRQREADSKEVIAMRADIKQNATDIAALRSSNTWLSRLVIAALISLVFALIAYGFQKLVGR